MAPTFQIQQTRLVRSKLVENAENILNTNSFKSPLSSRRNTVCEQPDSKAMRAFFGVSEKRQNKPFVVDTVLQD